MGCGTLAEGSVGLLFSETRGSRQGRGQYCFEAGTVADPRLVPYGVTPRENTVLVSRTLRACARALDRHTAGKHGPWITPRSLPLRTVPTTSGDGVFLRGVWGGTPKGDPQTRLDQGLKADLVRTAGQKTRVPGVRRPPFSRHSSPSTAVPHQSVSELEAKDRPVAQEEVVVRGEVGRHGTLETPRQ